MTQEGSFSLVRAVRAKLAESGLERHAQHLALRGVTADQTSAIGTHLDKRAGLHIPYWTLDGRLDKTFHRFRYLEPPRGFAANAKDVARYVQPPDTPPRVYFPPLVPWRAYAKDAARALWITEGELKAAKACAEGFATLGLGGVYAWRSAKRGQAFLPELEAFAWTDRTVYVAFDSDVATKPQVRQALTALCETLLARGARPFEVSLPSLPERPKIGLDDLLVLRDAATLEALAEKAEEFSASLALHRLNDEVAYVKEPGLVVELATGRRHSYSAFVQHAFADRWHEVQVATRSGVKLERKRTAQAWLEWPRRATFERFTYAPGEPRATSDGAYNLWAGWPTIPKRGGVKLWTELLDRLFEGARDERAWFERWLAYPIQHPGSKMLTAALLWSTEQGTGKSLVGYTVGSLYGAAFFELEPGRLHEPFNEWMFCRSFVMIDEVRGEDRRADSELLKRLITQRQVRVNEKYQAPFAIPDAINYYLTSNHPDAVYLEPHDRRFFVHEARNPRLEPAFARAFDGWRRSEEGRAALFDHLLRLDLSEFDPAAPAPLSRGKSEMTDLAASDLDTWTRELMRDPASVLGALRGVDSDLWTASQLLALYDPDGRKRTTANGLGRALRRAGARPVGANGVTRFRDATHRFFAIRDVARWEKASAEQLRRHLDEKFGDDLGAAPAARKVKF